jgi:hypothetical protein
VEKIKKRIKDLFMIEKRNEIKPEKIEESGIIERGGDLLIVDRAGIIQMIKDNSDRESANIDCNLIKMIQCFYNKMSVKQLNWLLEKVKYITRHNRKYESFRGIKDIQFI